MNIFKMDSVRNIVLATLIVYGIISVFVGILPSAGMNNEKPTPGLQPLTAQQLRGQNIYVGEGCAYCHTQVVRPLPADLVFGRPSVAGDFAYAPPELLGDHRNGPDLANIGARQPSEVWQYIHLYDPRAVVADSYMPSFRWLFKVKAKADPGDTVVNLPAPYAPKTGVVVVTQDGKDLVAYLLALKQVPLGKGAASQ